MEATNEGQLPIFFAPGLHLLLAAALPSTANLQSLISIDLLSGSNAFQSILTILTNVIIRYLECSNFYCKMLLEKKF